MVRERERMGVGAGGRHGSMGREMRLTNILGLIMRRGIVWGTCELCGNTDGLDEQIAIIKGRVRETEVWEGR